MPKNEIILGIDPGLATTGFGIIKCKDNKTTLVDYGTIATPTNKSLLERLRDIHIQLTKIIKKYKPNVCACEELFFCKNVKTALLVGQARGVILLTINEQKLPFHEFTPLQVKQSIAGYGAADKKQMQQMTKILLNLKKIPQPDDAADALAIALTCYQFINSPLYE
jgi:crossover junction endodeoxyribonuclease RuvC